MLSGGVSCRMKPPPYGVTRVSTGNSNCQYALAYRKWIAIDTPGNGQIMDIGGGSSINKDATIPQPAGTLEISTKMESIRSTSKAWKEPATTRHAPRGFINEDGCVVLSRVGQIREIKQNQRIAFLWECKPKERSVLSGGHFSMDT